MFGTQQEKIAKATLVFVVVISIFFLVKIVNEIREGALFTGGVPQTTITVSGEGEVFATPDIAVFTFSVEAESSTIKEAQDSASKSANSALEYLDNVDIDDEDIKTTNYSASPRYEYRRETIVCVTDPCVQPPGRQVLIGYRVTQTIQVKVRNIDEAGEVLAGVGGFAHTLGGLNLSIENEDEIRREARKIAIGDAKAKARILSKDLNVKLVRIVGFSESGFVGQKNRIFGAGDVFIEAESLESIPNIPTGENKITSNVSITYEIK